LALLLFIQIIYLYHMPKSKTPKLSNEEQVEKFMLELVHPLKTEIELLRSIIKNANSNLKERIKWNAPSYYTNVDLLTFNVKSDNTILLILHHVTCTKLKSDLLEGDFPDRRIIYFKDADEINSSKKELERIINEYVALAAA